MDQNEITVKGVTLSELLITGTIFPIIYYIVLSKKQNKTNVGFMDAIHLEKHCIGLPAMLCLKFDDGI